VFSVNKFLLVFFAIWGIGLYAKGDSCSDCAPPTQYIMQFLAKSGTRYRGSQDWLDELKKNKKVRTNFLVTRDTRLQKYSGVAVRGHDFASLFGEVPVDTVKARFELSINDDDNFVEIKSDIEDTEVKKVFNSNEIEQLKKSVELCDGKSEKQGDNCSECCYEIRVFWDEKTRTLQKKLTTSCSSKVPLDLFIQMLNEHKSKEGF